MTERKIDLNGSKKQELAPEREYIDLKFV